MRRFLGQLLAHTRAFFSNWSSYEAPVGTKLWLTIRNRSRALVTLRMCCGNDGEPGC